MICLFLFILAVGLSIVYFLNSDINPNIISYNHSVGSVIQDGGGIRGEFTAPSNYLGLLTVRFDNKDIIETKSTFRIKEKGSDTWYHSSSIDAVQYNIKPLYTFGLPMIADSKDKLYEFEVMLPDYVRGEPSLSLSTISPVITSQYAFPGKILIKNRGVLIDFIKQKLSYQIQSPYAPSIFFAYSLPLIGFVVHSLFLVKKYPISLRLNPISVLALLGIGLDIVVLKNNYSLLALILSLVWMAGIYRYKIKPETSVLAALVFLIWCPFLLVAHMEWVAEKSANWMFILITIGFFQYCFKSENIRNNDI